MVNEHRVHRYDGGFVFATTSYSLGHTCVCVSLHSQRALLIHYVGERLSDDEEHDAVIITTMHR